MYRGHQRWYHVFIKEAGRGGLQRFSYELNIFHQMFADVGDVPTPDLKLARPYTVRREASSFQRTEPRQYYFILTPVVL